MVDFDEMRRTQRGAKQITNLVIDTLLEVHDNPGKQNEELLNEIKIQAAFIAKSMEPENEKNKPTHTCNNCFYWDVTHDDEHKPCNSPHFVYTGKGDNAPDNGLEYWGKESYNAGLKTGPNFGCIHWKKR